MIRHGRKNVSPAAWPILGLLGLYRYMLSPLLHMVAPGSGCRYLPTCSEFAVEAIYRHGPRRGSWLALRRVCDCHPWGGHGHDPVPVVWPGWRFSRRAAEHSLSHSTAKRERSSLPRAR